MLLLGFTAAVAVICGRVAVRQLIWPIAASLLGLALLLPTLIVQLELTRGMAEKKPNSGKGIEQGLLATLAPFPFTRAEGFMGLPANREQVLETSGITPGHSSWPARFSAWGRCWPIAVAGPGWGNIRGRPPPSSRSGWAWAGKACCGR